jgi:hypothetical protein
MVMKLNDSRRHLISTWHMGNGLVAIYTKPSEAPRWIRHKGQMISRCDVAGCEEMPEKGDWYVRHPSLGVVCLGCAPSFGAIVPAD